MFKKIEENLEAGIKETFESKEFQDMLKSINEDDENYKFKVVVTTEGTDRDGEILKADGIDMKNYMKNPVVLVDHSYKIESIVGKTTRIYQENGKTIAEGVFAKGVEKAELIRSLYNQGFVKTVSIGFIAKERGTTNRDMITKAEMLEFSFVAVPANPEALSLDKKVYEKCVDLGLIKEFKTEEITSKTLKAGDMVTFRMVSKYTEMGVERTSIYPSEGSLPFMGKVLQKLENDEEMLTRTTEVLIGTKENPILTIQEHSTSENGPKILTGRVFIRKFSEFQIERLVTSEEIQKGFKDFNNDIDSIGVLDIMQSVRKDISEMKETFKTFSYDMEKEKTLMEAKKLGQLLSGSLSDFLNKAKK